MTKLVMIKKTLFLIILFILMMPSPILAWKGRAVGVSDGDTITVLNDQNTQIKIRLSGIDAPEKGQAFGKNSKELLSKLVYGKTIDVISIDVDRYGRTVARLYVEAIDVEQEMVRSGLAWVYDQYCNDPICKEWRTLQEQAQANRIGLWAQQSPTPPWEWRHGAKSSKKTNDVLEKIHTNELFHGNISSHIFHSSTCKYYDCNNCLEIFNTREDAIKADYRPCKICTK